MKTAYIISGQHFKSILLFLSVLCIVLHAYAQDKAGAPVSIEEKQKRLKQTLQTIPDGDSAIAVLKQITQSYFTGIYQLDSAKKYGQQLFDLGQRIHNQKGIALGQYYLGRVADGKADYATAIHYLESYLAQDVVQKDSSLLASGLYSMANVYIHQGELKEALNYQLQVLRLDEASGDSTNIGLSLNNLGIIMKELNRNQEAIQYLERTKAIFENLGDEANTAMALSNLGGLYAENGDNNKALKTFERTLDIYTKNAHQRGIALALEHIAEVQGKMGAVEAALINHHRALAIKKQLDLKKEIAESLYLLAFTHNAKQHTDSARYYYKLALDVAHNIGDRKGSRRAYKALADLEAANDNFKQAYQYFVGYHNTSDSILNESTAKQIVQLETKYGVEKNRTEISNLKEQQKLNQQLRETLGWALVATAIVAMLGIGIFIYRARINKRLFLIEQKHTLRAKIAYDQLKATQTQLIQSEKMASLGELTAGIAHEIQNPLNFVNNFSEVSNELIEELLVESSKPANERDEDLQQEILHDIKQNLEKINHHGKRADAIVKGMLQHSRTSTGHKELTAINVLCEEYLRLSYHGMRAKDKTFNAILQTDFDSAIEKINIIPQDIGRVLLNLMNNAFFAVNEKSKEADPDYQPTVIVSTKKQDDKVDISVKDNGPGIPDHIKEKIFQPFFTTKPTGSGTGLGLSLSYDIVKAHGGKISVDSKTDAFTCFTVSLPN